MSTFNLGLGLNGCALGGANDPGRGTLFRMYFDRGDLPIKMEYLCGGDKIGWTVRGTIKIAETVKVHLGTSSR